MKICAHTILSILSLIFSLTLLTAPQLYADTTLSRYEVKNLLRFKIKAIQELASHPDVIKETRERNAEEIPLANIFRIDEAWASYPDDHPQKLKMYSSPAGRLLKGHVEFQDSIYSEIFLTDSQGANITAWPLTTDYWQGDEVKWHRSFNAGAGDVYISNLAFDESSQTNAIQISVPVMDDGKAIGVLVAGIKLSFLQAKYLHSRHKDVLTSD